ncbi:MAG TPA: hypothetical protein VJS30_11655 [Paraburkholderia sp.]|nr:hypothetical protein [Paraburkholderia sp.]
MPFAPGTAGPVSAAFHEHEAGAAETIAASPIIWIGTAAATSHESVTARTSFTEAKIGLRIDLQVLQDCGPADPDPSLAAGTKPADRSMKPPLARRSPPMGARLACHARTSPPRCNNSKKQWRSRNCIESRNVIAFQNAWVREAWPA